MAHGRSNHKSTDTRRRCLEAGVKLFFEQPVHADPFKNVTIDGVAREVGVSRNAVYHHWVNKREYTRALAAYLLGNEDLYKEDFERIRAVVAATGDQPTLDAVCKVATADVASLTNNPVFAAMTTLAVVYVRGNEELEKSAAQGYGEIDFSTWQDIYQVVMSRVGRVPREPMTGESIGAILQALVEGSGIRHLFDPGALSQADRMVSSRHGLYALAVAAILAVMTRPEGSGDQRTTERVLEDLLAD